MLSNKYLLFCVAVFMLYISKGLAVKCKKCEIEDATDANAKCEDECEGGLCIKREAEMEDGKVKVSKACSANGVPGCGDAKLWGRPGTQCICSTDYCNTSPTLTFSSITILFAAFLAVIYS